MITALVSRLIILAFGTLYPAYASYKAVRTKDVKEYVKWMMYWIVFALFTCVETFTDVLLSFWFPFYYEIKVALVFWLLSPATRGSSFLYRNFVHPAFQKRENEIDEMILKTKERGYNTVLSLGSKSVTYATNVILTTAMKGGGGLMEQIIKRSYSLTDLPQKPQSSAHDVVDMNQRPTRPASRGRRVVGSTANLNMRFPEVDVDIRANPSVHHEVIGDIRSSEDISSGYSSTDQLYTEGMLTRSSSVSSARARGRGSGRTAVAPRNRAPLAEDWEDSETEDEFESARPMSPTHTPESLPTKSPPILSSNSVILGDHVSQTPVFSSPSNDSDKILSDSVFANDSMLQFTTEASQLSCSSSLDSNFLPDLGRFTIPSLPMISSSASLSPDPVLTGSMMSVNSDMSEAERRGKYNKKPAPPPPSPPPPPIVQPLRFPDRFTD